MIYCINNYKTILGKTGNWDGDDVIDIILNQYQTAKHISKSALIFFLGQIPSEKIVDECANVYFESGYIFETLLKHIFCSTWFYDHKYKNNKVKTPVELLVSLQRKTGMRAIGIKTTNYFLRYCGQTPFQPPSVAGWPIGENWLVGSDLVNRIFFPEVLLKIANRENKRESVRYKIFSRIKHYKLRHLKYVLDSKFDEELLDYTLKNNGINPSDWMINIELKNQDLSNIITHPKHQYS